MALFHGATPQETFEFGSISAGEAAEHLGQPLGACWWLPVSATVPLSCCAPHHGVLLVPCVLPRCRLPAACGVLRDPACSVRCGRELRQPASLAAVTGNTCVQWVCRLSPARSFAGAHSFNTASSSLSHLQHSSVSHDQQQRAATRPDVKPDLTCDLTWHAQASSRAARSATSGSGWDGQMRCWCLP